MQPWAGAKRVWRGLGTIRARLHYAKAHYRWDWVFSENSSGFHHFALAERLLDEAMDHIEQAWALLGRR